MKLAYLVPEIMRQARWFADFPIPRVCLKSLDLADSVHDAIGRPSETSVVFAYRGASDEAESDLAYLLAARATLPTEKSLGL